MNQTNKSIVVRERPDESFPQNLNCFQLIDRPLNLSNCGQGQIVVKVLYVGIDPVMRVWVSGAKTYIDPVQLQQSMPAFGVGICVHSNSQKWKKDQLVIGVLEWSEYCVKKEDHVNKAPLGIDKNTPFLPLFLSVYGSTGLTALLSMKTIDECNLPSEGKPKTMIVSSAAGSTGSFVVQLAKRQGYRVIGVVGSLDKQQFVKDLGASECISYNQAIDHKTGLIKTNNLSIIIHKLCPEGVDVYFDNSGEQVLDAVLPNMNVFSNIILCGATSTYNQWKIRQGLTNLSVLITKRIKGYGVMFLQDQIKLTSAFMELLQLVNDGGLKHQEEYLYGLEQAPFGLQKVLQGKNQGKIIIVVDEQLQKIQPKL